MVSEEEKTKLISAYKGGKLICYITHVPKSEAIIKTWACCLSIGKYYIWFRLYGYEFGIKYSG